MVPHTLNNAARMIIQGISFDNNLSSLYPPQTTIRLKMTTSKATEDSRRGSKSGSALGFEEGGLLFVSNFDLFGLLAHFTATVEKCT